MGIAVHSTMFAEAKIFTPDVYEGDRGYFKETYSTKKYRALGLMDEFVRDSVSFRAETSFTVCITIRRCRS